MPEIKSPVDRHKVSIFGAMDVNGQLIIKQSALFDAETFRQFLELFVIEAQAGVNKTGKKS